MTVILHKYPYDQALAMSRLGIKSKEVSTALRMHKLQDHENETNFMAAFSPINNYVN